MSLADDRQIYAHILVDRGRVYIDVDLFGVRRECIEPAGDPIVKARPDRDHQIAAVHSQIRLVGAVHTDHAEEMRVGRRKRAEPRSCGR